jgi:hypothetical protein
MGGEGTCLAQAACPDEREGRFGQELLNFSRCIA